jgi:hypothetical protein
MKKTIFFLIFILNTPLFANRPSGGNGLAGSIIFYEDSLANSKIEKRTETAKTLTRLGFIVPFLGSIISLVSIIYCVFLLNFIKKKEDVEISKKKKIRNLILFSLISFAFWTFAVYSLILII